MKKSRKSEKDFTRKRKLGFADYIVFLLKCNKRSLQAGLNEFCREAKSYKTEYSKQAFSKGRERIRPEAIQMLFEETVQEFYSSAEYQTYKGYRVSAIDGTDYNLPCNEELLATFGSEKYSGGTIRVQALGSCLYDVLNHFIMDASIGRHNENERVHAKAHLQKLVQNRTEKELVIFDRGYPSQELLSYLQENHICYLMRCTKNNFFKEIREFEGTDGIVVRPISKSVALPIRVLCYQNEVTMITNLDENEFSYNEIYELYHQRWKIETLYNDIKSKLRIEAFSGLTTIAIYQDFWATMTLSNLLAALEFDATVTYDRKNRTTTRHRKRSRKINRSTLINSLKDELICVFLTSSARKRQKILSRIIREVSKSLVDIVPDRHFQRDLSARAKLYPRNSKVLS